MKKFREISILLLTWLTAILPPIPYNNPLANTTNNLIYIVCRDRYLLTSIKHSAIYNFTFS